MGNDDWCVIREFPNYAGAEIKKSLLEAAGVATEIITSDRITALYTGQESLSLLKDLFSQGKMGPQHRRFF